VKSVFMSRLIKDHGVKSGVGLRMVTGGENQRGEGEEELSQRLRLVLDSRNLKTNKRLLSGEVSLRQTRTKQEETETTTQIIYDK